MRRLFFAGLLLLAVAGGASCKGKCRQLSEKLCDCAPNSSERDNCLRRVATSEGGRSISAESEATCAALIETCNCRLVDTPAGKVNCGLARPLRE